MKLIAHKLTVTLFMLTLLIGIVSCTSAQVSHTIPTVPILEPVVVEGLVCFTADDAEELGVYIIELERACAD